MRQNLLRRGFLPLFSVLLVFTSCVDDGFDLSDLDTDHLFVGDHWVLPLGDVVISAAEILDVDNTEEIDTDANGDYVASFSDVIYARPQQNPAIRNDYFDLPAVPLFYGSAPISSGETLPIPGCEGDLTVRGNQYVVRFDKAELNASREKSLMRITMNLTGLGVSSVTADIDIDLPAGFIPDTDYLPSDVDINGTTVSWNTPVAGSQVSVAIPMKEIDVTSGTTVRISGNMVANSSGTATNPQAQFRVSFENLDYTVIYGEFDLDFSLTPTSASIKSLFDVFECDDDTRLSFLDPHIIITSENELGMPVIASLEIIPDRGTRTVEVDDIYLSPAPYYTAVTHERFWIGEYNPGGNGYVFAYAPGLGDVIQNSREEIYVSGTGVQGVQNVMFFPKDGQATLDYTLEIPIAPAKEFYAVTRQVISDALDGDIKKYLFRDGTAEIYGIVTNSIPLRFDLEMIITDPNGDPVGIILPSQPIAPPVSATQASVSEVSFPFSESDMEKISLAANIDLLFISHGTESGDALNKADMLVLELTLDKTGGIHISSDDDDEE